MFAWLKHPLHGNLGRGACASGGRIPEGGGGVYCSRWCYGPPAHKYGLRATIWVVEVNGEPVSNLDAFIALVQRLGDRASVRLKTIDLNTKCKVFTLKTGEWLPEQSLIYTIFLTYFCCVCHGNLTTRLPLLADRRTPAR